MSFSIFFLKHIYCQVLALGSHEVTLGAGQVLVWAHKHGHHSALSYLANLYCTLLYCTALHCTALHYTALHCPGLHCSAVQCSALHCTALSCTARHCNALRFAVHCTDYCALNVLCVLGMQMSGAWVKTGSYTAANTHCLSGVLQSTALYYTGLWEIVHCSIYKARLKLYYIASHTARHTLNLMKLNLWFSNKIQMWEKKDKDILYIRFL